MTREEIVEGLKLLEDNMVHFDEVQNDKGEWIDVHELLFETIEALSQEPICDRDCEHCTWTECPIEPCDAISRKAVIDILAKYNLEYSKIAEDTKALPPVTQKSDVLDKIRDEIEEHTDGNNHCDEYLDGYNDGMKDALEIIDKYMK